MTVVSSGSTITFAGDGVQNSFDFNFRIYRAEDLCAVLRNSDGTEERLILGSDFKILSGLGSDSGGRVQYPINGTPLPAGQSITLYREIAYTQELELVDNDPFSAQLLNEAFDRGVMRDQQLQEQVDRALKYDISTPDAERITPQEMVQTISNARDEAVSARSGAIEAEENARGMLGDALAAQTGSEAARDRALLAQSAAEEARDSAIEISLGDLSSLRSPSPVLSAPVEAPEGTTVSIVITDHSDDGISSYEINTFGFGSASITGNTISWVLETSAVDVTKAIEVTRRRRGELYSDSAVHQLLVKHVSVQDGPTIAFADSIDGYPGASVDSEGVHAPAYSVPAENASQIASAKPEILIVNGKLIVLNGTTESVLKLAMLVAAGDVIITDQGECVVASVSSVTGVNKIPTMTAATTSGCTISASSEGGLANGEAWRIADGNPDTDWVAVEYPALPATITIALPEVILVTGYAVFGPNYVVAGTQNASSDWTLYGRKAGGEWIKLSEVSDQVNWGKNEKRSFSTAILECDTLQFQITRSDSGTQWIAMGGLEVYADEHTAILEGPLPGVPTKAIKKSDAILKVGAGAAGEYIGPKKELTLSSGIPSSTTGVNVESNESLKDKILKAGGLHKTLLFDGVEKEISSVSESIGQGGPEILTDQGVFIHSTSSPAHAASNPLTLSLENTTEFWGTNDVGPAVVNTGYVGSQFAEDTTVYGFYLRHWGGATTAANSMTSVMVQKSPDGVVWSDVEQIAITELGANLGQYMLSAPSAGKYWRLLAKTNSLCVNCSWAVSYLRWFSLETIYTTTIIPAVELPQVPSSVAIPDRCSIAPANYAYALDGEALKITGAEIVLENNPELKRLAMAVSGEGVTFKSGKIYIKEKL